MITESLKLSGHTFVVRKMARSIGYALYKDGEFVLSSESDTFLHKVALYMGGAPRYLYEDYLY